MPSTTFFTYTRKVRSKLRLNHTIPEIVASRLKSCTAPSSLVNAKPVCPPGAIQFRLVCPHPSGASATALQGYQVSCNPPHPDPIQTGDMAATAI